MLCCTKTLNTTYPVLAVGSLTLQHSSVTASQQCALLTLNIPAIVNAIEQVLVQGTQFRELSKRRRSMMQETHGMLLSVYH